MEAVTQSYVTGGLQKGNIARKELLFKAKEDWQQGGQAYGLQTNFDAIKTYEAEQNQAYLSGRITNETYQNAVKYSKNKFSGSFDENGKFQAFDGYKTAADLDLVAHFDQNLMGWLTETLGREIGSTFNGDYFYMDTEEGIPNEDIRRAVKNMAAIDPVAQAYLNQQDLIYDPRQDGISNSDFQIDAAMKVLADKYDGIKSTRQIVEKWRAKENLREYYRSKAITTEQPKAKTGHADSTPYNSRSGLTTVKYGEAITKATQALEAQKRDIRGYTPGQGTQVNRNLSVKDQAKIAKLDEEIAVLTSAGVRGVTEELAYYNSPIGKIEHPAVNFMLQSIPKKSVDLTNDIAGALFQGAIDGKGYSPRRIESDEAHLKRSIEASNKLVNHLAQNVTQVQKFSRTGYSDVYKNLVTEGAIRGLSASHINAEYGPSSKQPIITTLKNAGVNNINDVKIDDATASDWAKWGEDAIALNGYLMPGNNVALGEAKDLYSMPTGTEITINVGTGKPPLKLLLSDASEEENQDAIPVQQFANSYHNPVSAENFTIGQALAELSGDMSPQNIEKLSQGYGGIISMKKMKGTFVSKVNRNLHNDVEALPEVYELKFNKEGKFIGLDLAAPKKEDGTYDMSQYISYGDIISAKQDENYRIANLVTLPKIQ
jgi:hypothetical protein